MPLIDLPFEGFDFGGIGRLESPKPNTLAFEVDLV